MSTRATPTRSTPSAECAGTAARLKKTTTQISSRMTFKAFTGWFALYSVQPLLHQPKLAPQISNTLNLLLNASSSLIASAFEEGHVVEFNSVALSRPTDFHSSPTKTSTPVVCLGAVTTRRGPANPSSPAETRMIGECHEHSAERPSRGNQ
jgi:hypothetical protein